MLDLIWIQTIWHLDGISDFFFSKKADFEKISDDKKKKNAQFLYELKHRSLFTAWIVSFQIRA